MGRQQSERFADPTVASAGTGRVDTSREIEPLAITYRIFSTSSNRFAETGFLPVIKSLLSIDYHGIGVRTGANLSAELEYSFLSKLTCQVYSRS